MGSREKIRVLHDALKHKMFSTEVARWRVVLSSGMLTILCSVIVIAVVYLLLSVDGLACFRFFIVMALIWLCAELFVISYLSFEKSIPAYARGAIVMLMIVGNYWLCTLMFSLRACDV